MKICLVCPNQNKLPKFFEKVSNIPGEPVLFPALGPLYVLSNNAVKMDFLDNRVQGYNEKHLYGILSKYDLVAFGGTIFEAEEAINLSQRLRRENITTVYGGPNATINWELYTPYFNIIARGEGEGIFDEIVENFNDLSKVRGLVYEENGTTKINEPRPFIEDLENLVCYYILRMQLYYTTKIGGQMISQRGTIYLDIVEEKISYGTCKLFHQL